MSLITTDVAAANATSRSNGAVGAKALVPRYIRVIAQFTDTILDFGAGKDAAHTKRLKEAGFNVTAHEFGGNRNENHDELALTRQYDIVYASNVLNVQSSRSMLWDTLFQIKHSVKPGGRAVFNYPESPRLAGFDVAFMETTITEVFGEEPAMVGGTKRAPIWEVTL
jgi:hypothetical protein